VVVWGLGGGSVATCFRCRVSSSGTSWGGSPVSGWSEVCIAWVVLSGRGVDVFYQHFGFVARSLARLVWAAKGERPSG
jgi:hypothetical protein